MGPCHRGILAAVAAACLLVGACDGILFTGKLNTGDSFTLVGRFALNTGGDNRVIFDITKPTNYENLMFGAYYQSWEDWQSIEDDAQCVNKIASANTLLCTNENDRTCPDKPQGVVRKPVWDPELLENGTITSGTATFTFSVASSVTWLWVTLSNCAADACGAETGAATLCDAALMDIDFSISFENIVVDADTGSDTDNTYTHLGADEQPLLLIFAVSTGLEGLAVIFLALVMTWLRNDPRGNMLHHTVKFLFAAVICSFLGSLCYVIHLAVLDGNGVGVVALVYIAYIAFALGATMLLLLAVVIAKGWTIVRRKISAGGRMKIAAFITTFLVIFLTCIFWAELNQNIGEYATIWESPPGIVLVVIRFAAGLWFVMAAITTTKRFSKKRGFFIKFFIFAGLWIFSMPIACCIAYAVSEYARQSVIFGVVLAFDAIAQWSFIVMFNPKGAASKGFPFHAMVENTLKKKQDSAREIDNLAQGEVGQEALLRMKDLTDQLLERFSDLEQTVNELESAAVQMKELDDEDEKVFDEEEAGEGGEQKFSEVGASTL